MRHFRLLFTPTLSQSTAANTTAPATTLPTKPTPLPTAPLPVPVGFNSAPPVPVPEPGLVTVGAGSGVASVDPGVVAGVVPVVEGVDGDVADVGEGDGETVGGTAETWMEVMEAPEVMQAFVYSV